MSNQTKIGLLLGLGVVLLVGIIVSDHLATQSQDYRMNAGPVVAPLGEGNPTNQPVGIRNTFLANAGMPARDNAFAAPQPGPLAPVVIGGNSVPPAAIAVTPGTEPGAVPALVPGTAAQPGQAQIPAPTAPTGNSVALVTPPAAPAPPAPRTYTIKDGDTLSSIAAATLGSRNRWKEILDANAKTLGAAKALKIGTQLVIPETEAKPAPAASSASLPTAPVPPAAKPVRTYTVGKGDLLGSIAAKTLGSTKKVKELVEANRKVLPQGEKTVLKTGMVLTIPAQ